MLRAQLGLANAYLVESLAPYLGVSWVLLQQESPSRLKNQLCLIHLALVTEHKTCYVTH